MQRIPEGFPLLSRARKPGAKRPGESHLDVQLGQGSRDPDRSRGNLSPGVHSTSRNFSLSCDRGDGASCGGPSFLLRRPSPLPLLPAPPVLRLRHLPSPASLLSGADELLIWILQGAGRSHILQRFCTCCVRSYNIPRFTSFLYYLPHITWLFIICHTLD
jgi:hypothetical protein